MLLIVRQPTLALLGVNEHIHVTQLAALYGSFHYLGMDLR